MSEERRRLFVGLFPSPSLAEELERQIAGWRPRLGERGVRWVRPEQLHATLCFLGDVETERLPKLEEALSRATEGLAPLALELAGLGCFPDARRPRVLWAGLKGDLDGLLTLQKAVAAACAPFLQKPDDKPFAAHLTLARLKDPSPELRRSVEKLLESHSDASFGKWTAAEVRLIRSELGRDGSRYAAVRSFPLNPR
jgi:RNA 2',3'-cyclic 3'-phosphodiesterase